MSFVANFVRFPAVQKFWKLVKIWQSYREFKSGNFFETQCIARWKACGRLPVRHNWKFFAISYG